MLLIDAVNRVLPKISENKVKSVNSSNVAELAGQAVSDSYAALCSETTWSWGERLVTPVTWNADHALLDEGVVDIKRVYYDNRLLHYLKTAQFQCRMFYSGTPSYWSLLGRQVLFSPFPDEEQQLKVKLLVQYHDTVDPSRDDHLIEIPRELEYLLILRACMQMSVDHLKDSNMLNAYSGEYTRLLSQMKPRFTTSQPDNSAIA